MIPGYRDVAKIPGPGKSECESSARRREWRMLFTTRGHGDVKRGNATDRALETVSGRVPGTMGTSAGPHEKPYERAYLLKGPRFLSANTANACEGQGGLAWSSVLAELWHPGLRGAMESRVTTSSLNPSVTLVSVLLSTDRCPGPDTEFQPTSPRGQPRPLRHSRELGSLSSIFASSDPEPRSAAPSLPLSGSRGL